MEMAPADMDDTGGMTHPPSWPVAGPPKNRRHSSIR